jgi:hypothetical protein
MDDATHSVVLSLLAKWSCVPAGGVRPEHHLVKDLRMDGDDYGMSFVPELNRRLGIKPTRQDWEHIATVADVLALVDRHVLRQEPPAGVASA